MPDPAGRGIIRLIRLAVLTLLSILACPALAPRLSAAKAAAPPEDTTRRGLLLVVGGVGGLELMANAAQWALPRAGIHHEVHDFIWTHGKGKILSDLQDARHCLKKADELAAQILLFKADDLDRPIYILAKSGGTGLVLAAAEQLPPNTIERIVLLSAAVSPTYDLRPALRATEHGIVSFYSPLDRFILGWGTSRFGTIDRVYGPSAGLNGFIIPRDLDAQDRALYDRLIQVRWNPRMILEGHTGGHLGTGMPIFLEKEVAPWLKP